MNLICDKIEDTALQMKEKGSYEAQKKRMIEQKQKNEFKPVAENVKIINLGIFGNAKKKMEEGQVQM